MRSPIDALLLTLLLAAPCSATVVVADPTTSSSVSAAHPALGAALTLDEVRAAAAKLSTDPNLGGTHKIRSLRWTQPRAPDRPQNPPPWIEGLFEYLGQTASVLLWVAGAIAAAVAVLWAYRTF